MPYGYTNPVASPSGQSTTPDTGETFIQRQLRLQGKQPATSSTSSSSYPAGQEPQQPTGSANYSSYATGTPVSGGGKIPEPAPQVAPAPTPAPAAPQPEVRSGPWTVQDFNEGLLPETTNFSWGSGGQAGANMDAAAGSTVGWTPQQWVDYNNRYHPRTTPTTVQPKPGTAAPTNPNESNRGTASQAGTFTQFQAPNQDFENWQQLQLIQQILANPDTMSPDVINKLQQKSTEDEMAMEQQLRGQQEEDLASRGFNLSGGTADAQQRARQEEMMKAILGKRRDIEIAASQQNRQDELGALGAAEGILQGQTGRAGSVYGNILQGEQANADDALRHAQLALQDKLGSGGLAIDQSRLGEQGREFDLGQALNILQFLEDQRQFNDNSGFNWTQLVQNGQNSTIDRIMKAAGF